jgi:hypothetical protein
LARNRCLTSHAVPNPLENRARSGTGCEQARHYFFPGEEARGMRFQANFVRLERQ